MNPNDNTPPGYFPPPPPPGQMPPPPGYQGQPMMQRQRFKPRNRWWRILGLVLLVGVVGFNVLLFAGMFAGGGALMGGGDPRGIREYSRKGGSGSKIAVIPIEGVIMEQSGGLFGGSVNPVTLAEDGLRRAKRDQDVAAVILEVNSPGGGITASDTIHKAILDFKETGKPVVVYMKDLAASGGYYVSAPADHIVASRTTLTGSIGVIIQGFNFHGTLTEVVKGQDATIKAGGNKAMGSMFADPESQEYKEGRALLQELADEYHAIFKGIVQEGRGSALAQDWETYADGRVVSASQALKIGLVDEIGYFDDAVKAAEGKAGITDAVVVEYGREAGLGALFGLNAEELERVQKQGAQAVNAQIAAELQAQLRLYPGRPMAIWVP